MSFLEKFKDKMTVLKKDQVGDILGEKSIGATTKINSNQMHLLKLASIPQQNNLISPNSAHLPKRKAPTPNPVNLKSSNIKTQNKNQQSPQQPKKIIQNPFLVQNQFFLDQEQHQAVLKKRKQQQIKQRIQKQRKKRQQLKQQMMKSMKTSPQKKKYTKKQWVKLGGLGPNIGGQQWTKKKNLQQKMLKFAQQIKRINLQKSQGLHTQSLDLRPNKSMTENNTNRDIDSRSIGIKYSKTIQKPTFYTLQKTRYNNNDSNQMRTYNSDFQAQIVRSPVKQSTFIQDTMMDPQQNEFSNLKIQRNYSELQKLEDRHKEFKKLVYGTKN